jgi:hypothetical protein
MLVKKPYSKPQILTQNINMHPLLTCCINSSTIGNFTYSRLQANNGFGTMCCCCFKTTGAKYTNNSAGYCKCNCDYSSCGYPCQLFKYCSALSNPRSCGTVGNKNYFPY